MVKKWRPDGWDPNKVLTWEQQHPYSAFELGADTMLEALIHEGDYVEAGKWTDDVASFVPDVPGYIVFIPEWEEHK